jgi:hypothetical protein
MCADSLDTERGQLPNAGHQPGWNVDGHMSVRTVILAGVAVLAMTGTAAAQTPDIITQNTAKVDPWKEWWKSHPIPPALECKTLACATAGLPDVAALARDAEEIQKKNQAYQQGYAAGVTAGYAAGDYRGYHN